MKLDCVFHKDHIEFRGYQFPQASVARNPILRPDQIQSILMRTYPPEIILQSGEVIFVSKIFAPELEVFRETHRKPRLLGADIWGSLNDVFLDTEFTESARAGSLRDLRASGFDENEIQTIRDKVDPAMMAYNSILWEWVHLGHMDLLAAYQHYDKKQLDEIYPWSMEVAARGHKNLIVDDREDSPINFSGFQLLFHSDMGSLWEYQRLDDVAEILFQRYTEPHRCYHTASHLIQMSGAIHGLCGRLDCTDEERKTLLLASWFHDAVYDPTARDNETRSAELLHQLFPSSNIVDQAAQLIEFTKDHLHPKNQLEKIMADADLAILGAGPESYSEYATLIRHEFSHVSQPDFVRGRLAFLAKLQKRLTETQLFWFLQPIFKENALVNIRDEMNSLA